MKKKSVANIIQIKRELEKKKICKLVLKNKVSIFLFALPSPPPPPSLLSLALDRHANGRKNQTIMNMN